MPIELHAPRIVSDTELTCLWCQQPGRPVLNQRLYQHTDIMAFEEVSTDLELGNQETVSDPEPMAFTMSCCDEVIRGWNGVALTNARQLISWLQLETDCNLGYPRCECGGCSTMYLSETYSH